MESECSGVIANPQFRICAIALSPYVCNNGTEAVSSKDPADKRIVGLSHHRTFVVPDLDGNVWN